MDLSNLNVEYVDDKQSIIVNGFINIPSNDKSCLNVVYNCDFRKEESYWKKKNNDKIMRENNGSRIEGCKIHIDNQIYEIKNERNIFECVVEISNKNKNKERMIYNGSRLIEKKKLLKSLFRKEKSNNDDDNNNNNNSIKANIKFNLNLKNVNFTYDYNSKIIKAFGNIFPDPKNICDADKSSKRILCKVTKISFSTKDYPSGSSVVDRLMSFYCDGTYVNANAVFNYPNYYSCCVYNYYNDIIAFGQVKTPYYDKDTDNNNDDNDSTVTIAISGVVAALIVICCCIACCCCSFMSGVKTRMRPPLMPPPPPPPPPFSPYYNNYGGKGYYPNNPYYYPPSTGHFGRNHHHSFHNDSSRSSSRDLSADMVPCDTQPNNQSGVSMNMI